MASVEIVGNDITIKSKNGQRLYLHIREDGDTDIISFEIGIGGMAGTRGLPSIEFGRRDTLLRHTGNRLEQID